MDAATAEERFARAIDEAIQQDYSERPDGRWETPTGEVLDEGVDPLPVQKAALVLAFQRATGEDDFDIFSEVGPGLLVEGKPLADNARIVLRQFSEKTDRYEREIERQFLELGIDPHGDGATDEGDAGAGADDGG